MDKKFLLIVEPEEQLRNSLVKELSDVLDYHIITAKDGVEAYQKTRNQKFDVILAEYKLKKMNGAELIKSTREVSFNSQCPFIIYSEDHAEVKTKTRGIKNIEFLKKPQTCNVLSEKIKSLENINASQRKFSLDVDFINPFIDESIETLNKLCKVDDITANKPYLLENETLDIDISGTLAISSPYFKGSIAVSFKDEIYKKILDQILQDNDSQIDIKTQDGVTEIINIIFGRTKAILNKKGYSLDRAIPAALRGHGHKISTNDKIPTLVVPFRASVGNFWIQICVKAL